MSRQLPREDYLHYLWRVRDVDLLNLQTTEGLSIKIKHWGEYNRNAGPDFINGVIQIGDTVWSGSIEMHVLASDWRRHAHDGDSNYDNVILHVVYAMDQKVTRQDGTVIHTVELKDRLNTEKWRLSEFLLNQIQEVPCQAFLNRVQSIHWQNWIDRVFVERLESKAAELKEELIRIQFDWDQLFFQIMARSLGQPVNGEAFWELAKRTPVRKLCKLRRRGNAVEAILFGQAGLLNKQDPYARALNAEYEHYSNMLGLIPMEPVNWRFMRMRPPGFPTRRIAQLAGWIEWGETRFGSYLNANHLETLKNKMKFTASDYWQNHVRFGKSNKPLNPEIGNFTFSKLVANGLLPMYYLYEEITGTSYLKSFSLSLASEIKAEKNRITRLWSNAPVPIRSLVDSQGLIQLTKEYCRKRRCLECGVGCVILSRPENNKRASES